MVDLNWNQPSGGLPPGIYAFKVREAKEKTSKAGQPTIELVLDASEFDKKLCYDTISLAGDGWFYGARKLKALGVGEGVSSLDPTVLIGAQGWVAVKEEEYNGRKSLKVDVKLGEAGYFKTAPLGVTRGTDPFAQPAVTSGDPFAP